MGQVITQTVTLETEVCCNCSVLFAVPDSLQRRRRADGDWFYCPNGHKQHYSESELDRVRKKLNEQTRAASDMADRATREPFRPRLSSNSVRSPSVPVTLL